MSEKQSSNPVGAKNDILLKVLAWSAILLICIPQLIYRLFDPLLPGELVKPYWLAIAETIILALLCLVTWIWSPTKPLRGFFLAVLAFNLGDYLIRPYIMYSTIWSNWMDQLPWGVWLVVDRVGTHFLPVALMTLTLIGSTIGRKELFLVRGNPSASVEPTPILFMKEPEPWTKLARNVLIVVVIILLIVGGMQLRPNLRQISHVLIYLPAIIIGAVINAFGEEYEMRCVNLARLLPVLGKQQAIFITSALFGLLHYFGNPGSIPGVLMAAYLGYISAKSMVETGGFVWAFLLHFIGYVIIYAFWAM